MVKQHKDKIFVIVMLITLGNIVYWNFYRLMYIEHFGFNFTNILILISGIVAIYAILYLLRQNNKRNKEMKEKLAKLQAEQNNKIMNSN